MKWIFVCLTFFLISCSSTGHKSTEYENIPHEHNISKDTKIAYEGKCAGGVLHENCNVKANLNVFHDHKNVRYFFSSEEAKNEFVRDIDRNIIKADKIWDRERGRAADRL